MNQSRRKFLGQAALWLTGASLADTLLPLDAQAALKYKVGPWRGDDFAMGHKMRNGEVPDFPQKVEAQVDFVIVGGGLSALTAAHKLKNHNYLLLEQYPQLGGQARGENHNGLWYSLAAAYFVDLEGAVGQLCDEFGLKPVSIGPEKTPTYGRTNGSTESRDRNQTFSIRTSKPWRATSNQLWIDAPPQAWIYRCRTASSCVLMVLNIVKC